MVSLGNRRISSRKFLMIVIDQLLCLFSIVAAFNLHTPGPFNFFPGYLATFGWLYVATALGVFATMGFYAHIWRFASILQYIQLGWGVFIQTALIWAYQRLTDQRITVDFHIIYAMLLFILVTGVRVAYRVAMNHPVIREIFYGRMPILSRSIAKSPSNRRRIMVIGAGETGSQIVREMQSHPDLYDTVAIIDDNPLTHTYRVYGVPVYGGRDSIPEAVAKYRVETIVLAVPSASRQTIRELVDVCKQTKCELKTMPRISDLIDGKVSLQQIKPVDIEDLLGRDEIVLNTDAIADYLTGENVLVTGGGGSIGSELCRQIARFHPKSLIIFDIYENNAYQLQYELKGLYGDELNLLVLIGSVRDKLRLMKVFEEHKPSVIFHAAAHKHVPLMEDSPGEAVKNNIIGTYNVADEAAKAGVKRFVLISTDKAVNPTNVMGATKRVAEMLVQSLSTIYPQTRFAAVRFGNVLGSNGSVIPLFRRQIANERRVTVTHPDITRYFMTIPEAARLVIQAGAIAKGGEIFVLDMGEPVKIDSLARDLIRLSGLEPDIDVKVEYTGLRPGEKMYEELFQDLENMTTSDHEMIFRLKPITNQETFLAEIGQLRQIIQWENPLYRELIAWLTEHYIEGIIKPMSLEMNPLPESKPLPVAVGSE